MGHGSHDALRVVLSCAVKCHQGPTGSQGGFMTLEAKSDMRNALNKRVKGAPK